MSGRLAVIGLGPGDQRYLTQEAHDALEAADALYGYAPYLDRVPARPKARRGMPPTIARKARALKPHCAMPPMAPTSPSSRAATPACSPWPPRCARRSRADPHAWRALDIAIVPGITAMLAVAARAGAPLGHDFCALSLSDNLKPWELIERRLDAAASAGFVIALYNPVSRARPWQLGKAFALLSRHLPGATPVIFGRAVGRGDESVTVTTLAAAADASADMATLIIVGSRETRLIVARGAKPAGLYAAGGRRRAGMIEPGKHLLDRRRRSRPRAEPDASA